MKEIAKSNSTLEPYFIVYGEDEFNMEAHLVVDKNVIDVVEMADLPFALLAAFFVFNICYPRGCSNFYTMLEILMLHYSCEKANPSVKQLLPKIHKSTQQANN